jgi:hypothetical protein
MTLEIEGETRKDVYRLATRVVEALHREAIPGVQPGYAHISVGGWSHRFGNETSSSGADAARAETSGGEVI